MCCLILMVTVSCSTKKNTFSRRAFHNLTSHYNGYWNALDNYENTVDEMVAAGADNFLTTLQVNYYGNAKEAQAMKPSLDKSIEKAYLMTRKHSMVYDGKENVKWMDDCYMLIGQCYFYEKDFLNARRIFQYVIDNFPNNTAAQDARLWLASTYTQNKEFEKAVNVLEQLSADNEKMETSLYVRKHIDEIYADFFILQGQHDEAVPHLYSAIKMKNSRRTRQRIYFIIGQILQQQQDYAGALEAYGKSAKGTDQRISFNSKIRMAQCTDIDDSEAVVKTLTKMLREDKNKEYRDQIYYALSEIARRKGDTASLVQNLRMSVSESVSNDYQKAVSAHELADIYFANKKYIDAQPYYDTTVSFLPQDYPNYVNIKQKTMVLGNLVQQLLVVQNEDSLQTVAKMPENERKAMIDSIIKKIQEDERIAKEIEMQRQRNYNASVMNQYENDRTQSRLGNNVSWYFYSPQTVSAGINEFKRKWGDRKYEDLWVLRDKMSVSWDELGEVDTTTVDTTDLVTDIKDPQYYLQNLPLTEEKMKLSNEKIADALYKAGFIAMDEIKDYTLSNECFNELVKRFPSTDRKLTAYIMMYLNCKEMNDNVCMNTLSANIVGEYPESDFAKLMVDPSYIVKMNDKINAPGSMYSDAYFAMTDNMYDLVQLYSDEGVAIDNKKYNARFEYLAALSRLAKNGETDTMAILQLQDIVRKYPSDQITPVAQNLLTYLLPEEQVYDSTTLATMKEEKQKEETLKKEMSIYSHVCNARHFYVLIVKNDVNTKAVNTRVSDYILRYNKFDNLRSVERVFDDNYEMITVSEFPNCDKALEFYNNAITNNYIFSALPADKYYHFVISQPNYPIFYQNKNIEAYLKFFEANIMANDKKQN